MLWPEIRVKRGAPGLVTQVSCVPVSGPPGYDLTCMDVAEVAAVITPDGLPRVQVTFEARLVEEEE